MKEFYNVAVYVTEIQLVHLVKIFVLLSHTTPYVPNEALREHWCCCSTIISLCCCPAAPVRFDLSCYSTLPLICTNDLAEIRYQFYKRSLLFSGNQVGERPPAKLLTTKWLWTIGPGGSFWTYTIRSPPFSPLLRSPSILSRPYPCLFSIHPSSFLHFPLICFQHLRFALLFPFPSSSLSPLP